jgi:hypothetical protein
LSTKPEFNAQAKNAHFDPVLVKSLIRLYQAIEHGIFKIVIGRHKTKLCVELRQETIDAVVKIMIA